MGAALRAARKMRDAVTMSDFYDATDRVVGGLEKRISSMTLKEKEMIAHHEAGHAVAGWFLENAEPLLKVTIIPRGGGALGFAQYLPKDLQLYTAAQLYDMICMTLGGRAAEQIFYNRVSTGAADDLNKVTRLAYGQISIYGMNDSIGNLSFPPDQNQDGLQAYKPYSEMMAEKIDTEAMELVKNAYARTLDLLTEKKDLIAALAKALLEKENLGHEDLVAVLGDRPFKNDDYRNYLSNTKEFAVKWGEDSEQINSTAEEKSATEEKSASSEEKSDEAKSDEGK